MQRAEYLTVLSQIIRVLSHRQRVRIKLNHSIHVGPALIQRLYTGDVFPRELNRAKFSGGHFGLQLGDSRLVMFSGNVAVPITVAVSISVTLCIRADHEDGAGQNKKNFFHNVGSPGLIMRLIIILIVFATMNSFRGNEAHLR